MKLREQFDKLVQERNIQAAALSPIWFQYPAVVKIRRFLFVSKVWSYVTLLLIVYSLLINLITVTFVNATYKPVISALDILVLSIFLVEWVLKCVVTPVKDYLLSLGSILSGIDLEIYNCFPNCFQFGFNLSFSTNNLGSFYVFKRIENEKVEFGFKSQWVLALF